MSTILIISLAAVIFVGFMIIANGIKRFTLVLLASTLLVTGIYYGTGLYLDSTPYYRLTNPIETSMEPIRLSIDSVDRKPHKTHKDYEFMSAQLDILRARWDRIHSIEDSLNNK